MQDLQMATFSFIISVCFLLFQGVFHVLGEQYDVTVITDPTNGPFRIGNRINFTCHIYPMPLEPVTYSWHAVKDAYGPTSLSGDNTTHYTPNRRHLHFSWFFCKVYSNQSLIGVGRRLIEIHGFVFSVEPLYRTIILGYTIKLQVNISNDYEAEHIRTLGWYHNDTELQASDRVLILNSGREIIIYNASHTDAGSYRVEVTSLTPDIIFGSDDSACDSLWLPLLRNHAAHAPVTFTVRVIIESPSLRYPTEYWRLSLYQYASVYGNFSALLIIRHDINLTSSWTSNIISGIISSDYVSSTLSVNGSRLASAVSNFNLSQTIMAPSVLMQVLTSWYNLSDQGVYVQQQDINPYDLYDVLRGQGYGCMDHYYYAALYLNLYSVSLVAFSFILKPPSQVNISAINFPGLVDFIQLECTAGGGVPDSHYITLLHSNQQVASEIGNNLQIYVANCLFGEFTCIVESLHSTKQVSLLLQEKVSFQFLFAAAGNNQMVCMQWKVDTAFYEDIRNLFKTVCDCTVDLEDVKIDCSMTESMLLSGTVIYSNSQGNITASTLLDMLQVWLLTFTDPVIMLQRKPFKLITQCPIKLNSATADTCSNSKVASKVSKAADESAVIGGSFIGGLVTGILTCILILCVGVCLLKLRADLNMRRAGSASESASPTGKEEEVTMGTNQAYETVEMRYRSAPTRQPPSHAPSTHANTADPEEPVYENQQQLHTYTIS